VLQVLERPDEHVAINLLGVPLEDRPTRFAEALATLLQMETRTGRPHSLVVDKWQGMRVGRRVSKFDLVRKNRRESKAVLTSRAAPSPPLWGGMGPASVPFGRLLDSIERWFYA
jgi:hypothetical protein